MLNLKWILIAFVLALSISACASAQLPRYTFEELGTLGGHESDAYAINDSGVVAGSASLPATGTQEFLHATVFSNGQLTDLGVVGDAYGINNSGLVVGRLRDRNDYLAFAYNNGTFVSLGAPLNTTESGAYAVNNNGIVVSTALLPGNNHLYESSNGVATDLLVGGMTNGTGINDHGVIAYSSDGRPFRYVNGSQTALATLGGDQAYAFAINDSGVIVGYAQTADHQGIHAVSYTGDSILDLGTLGGSRSFATAINSGGTIVGWADDGIGGSERAWVYSGGVMTDLNTLTDGLGSFQLDYAYGINSIGQIVGIGFTPDGDRRGFILTPSGISAVPEPRSAVLATGLLSAGLWAYMLRRKVLKRCGHSSASGRFRSMNIKSV